LATSQNGQDQYPGCCSLKAMTRCPWRTRAASCLSICNLHWQNRRDLSSVYTLHIPGGGVYTGSGAHPASYAMGTVGLPWG